MLTFQVANAPCGLFLLDENLRFQEANPGLCELLGRPHTEVLGRPLDDFLAPTYRLLFHMQAMTMLHANGRVEEIFLNFSDAQGRDVPVLFNAVRLQLNAAQVIECVALRVNERKRMEDDLFNIKKSVEHVPGVVFQYLRRADGHASIPYASEGLRTLYGLRPIQVLHSADILHERTHAEDMPAFISSIDASAQNLTPWHLEYRIHLPNKGVRWLEGRATPEARINGDVLWHGYVHDITERKALQSAVASEHDRTLVTLRNEHKAVAHLAAHDHLTGLPNRAEFERVLKRLFESAQDSGAVHALCCIDLDRFKQINDRCGHAAGDEVLRQVAGVLKSSVRARDTVARLGGDEFALLLENCDLEAASRVAEVVCRHVAMLGFEYEEEMLHVGASIGLALIDEQWGDAHEVQLAADRACFAAKAAGRGGFRVASFKGL